MLAALWLTAAGCSNGGEEPLDRLVDRALERAERQALALAERYEPLEGRLPRTWENGRDVSSDSRWWCSGFFPGVLWYLYENDPRPELLQEARKFTARVEDEQFTTDNHDVGFILYCSFGNGWRLTKDPDYARVLLNGARSLATRYNEHVGLIRSWDHNRDRWQYPVIIDNMMNLELLMWAADYSGNDSLRRIACSHADKTMEHHFRPDYSSYHVVSYDTLSARPHVKQTHQGLSDDSAWSRGQAWGLYGYTAMFRWTGDDRYLQQARHIARFLLQHPNMPEDGIPYWDFDAPADPSTPRDASAAAIMASALIELSGFTSGDESQEYRRFAIRQIRTLASPEYTAAEGENGNFILRHSTGAFPFDSEVDVPLAYADYYYVEALTRLKRLLDSSDK